MLLDLGGVVHVGDEPLPGALDALERLRAAGLPLRYITNTTRTPKRAMLAELHRLGVAADDEELFMPALAARRHLEARGSSPHLLVHPALEEDFAGLPGDGPEAVVVGDAAEGFTYQALNAAFRALVGGAEFLALARNRSFQDTDGVLSLDAGPFVAALEYASGREATLFGKPSCAFFEAALASLGCAADRAVMVGDDVEIDVAGAMAAGLMGVLLRCGKYRPGARRWSNRRRARSWRTSPRRSTGSWSALGGKGGRPSTFLGGRPALSLPRRSARRPAATTG